MKKQHFIFLGKAGLIYYSWMFVVLFIGLIILYENTAPISWSATGVLVAFFVILFYTFLTSYWNKKTFKLPFRAKINIQAVPKLIKKIWKFNVYQMDLSDYQKYYLLRFNYQRS